MFDENLGALALSETKLNRKAQDVKFGVSVRTRTMMEMALMMEEELWDCVT